MPSDQEDSKSSVDSKSSMSAVRSIELLTSDPSRYGRLLAQEAFDHFVANRMEHATSSDNVESDRVRRRE